MQYTLSLLINILSDYDILHPLSQKAGRQDQKLAVCRPTLTKPYSESVYIYFYVEQLVSTKVESSKKESGVFVFA